MVDDERVPRTVRSRVYQIDSLSFIPHYGASFTSSENPSKLNGEAELDRRWCSVSPIAGVTAMQQNLTSTGLSKPPVISFFFLQ